MNHLSSDPNRQPNHPFDTNADNFSAESYEIQLSARENCVKALSEELGLSPEEAENHTTTSRELDIRSPWVMEKIANDLRDIQKFEEAERYYKEALRVAMLQNQKEAICVITTEYATMLIELENRTEAERLLRIAVDLVDPSSDWFTQKDWKCVYRLASLLRKKGEIEESKMWKERGDMLYKKFLIDTGREYLDEYFNDDGPY